MFETLSGKLPASHIPVGFASTRYHRCPRLHRAGLICTEWENRICALKGEDTTGVMGRFWHVSLGLNDFTSACEQGIITETNHWYHSWLCRKSQSST